jgi:hypothetical protein
MTERISVILHIVLGAIFGSLASMSAFLSFVLITVGLWGPAGWFVTTTVLSSAGALWCWYVLNTSIYKAIVARKIGQQRPRIAENPPQSVGGVLHSKI